MMTIEQGINGKPAMWPRDRTATRDPADDFSRMVFGVDIIDLGVSGGSNVSHLILSAVAPVSSEPFNWEAAEKRADWEGSHGRFAEFSDVKDLLSNLHS